jgi:hypothetical protein
VAAVNLHIFTSLRVHCVLGVVPGGVHVCMHAHAHAHARVCACACMDQQVLVCKPTFLKKERCPFSNCVWWCWNIFASRSPRVRCMPTRPSVCVVGVGVVCVCVRVCSRSRSSVRICVC